MDLDGAPTDTRDGAAGRRAGGIDRGSGDGSARVDGNFPGWRNGASHQGRSRDRRRRPPTLDRSRRATRFVWAAGALGRRRLSRRCGDDAGVSAGAAWPRRSHACCWTTRSLPAPAGVSWPSPPWRISNTCGSASPTSCRSSSSARVTRRWHSHCGLRPQRQFHRLKCGASSPFLTITLAPRASRHRNRQWPPHLGAARPQSLRGRPSSP